MKLNESPLDRAIRIVLGAVLILLIVYLELDPTVKWILGIAGAILLVTGITGFCLLYKLFKLDTTKK